jgi:hypothetical protein
MDNLPTALPQGRFNPSGQSPIDAIRVELAKCLQLVVPASMTADDRAAWIMAASEALEGITAQEVAAVSQEIRRSVMRPSQIVPEISKRVYERRASRNRFQGEPDPLAGYERTIQAEAQRRRGMARNQSEVEDAWLWERNARKEVGLHVPPLAPKFSQREIDEMPTHIRSMGLKYGFLAQRPDGSIFEVGA